MKAFIVNFDVACRVVVDDDATEEQIIEKAVEYVEDNIYDISLFECADNVLPDEECPYGTFASEQ